METRDQPQKRRFPVFILCRDRLTPLVALVSWLERVGQNEIYLIDNDSSFPPLLDYLRETRHHVVYLKENLGHLALWRAGLLDALGVTGQYIVTDPDLLPVENCPDDAIDVLSDTLDRYPDRVKAGFGLRIDDLPDHYPRKSEVIAWESKFWANEIAPGLYDADIDTTFALYRAGAPFSYGPSIRTGPPYLIQHIPWYADPARLSAEDAFCHRRAHPAVTNWSIGELQAAAATTRAEDAQPDDDVAMAAVADEEPAAALVDGNEDGARSQDAIARIVEQVIEQPYDLIACSWPQLAESTDGRWTSLPRWDAPVMPWLPQPRWDMREGIPLWGIDWRAFFLNMLPQPQGGQMRERQIAFQIKMRRSGDLVVWCDEDSMIRRVGEILIDGRSADGETRHEFRVREGDLLEIVSWQTAGEWWWMAGFVPPKLSTADRLTILEPLGELAARRLAQPDGPPLKMLTDGRHPYRVALTVYSAILNGYAPSEVLIYGSHQWSDAARSIIDRLLPFATVVPIEDTCARLERLGGPDLPRLALTHWWVMQACVSLLEPPSEFCYVDDDIFILDRLDDALAAFADHDLVFQVDRADWSAAYQDCWRDVLPHAVPMATGEINAGFHVLRHVFEPTDVAQAMLRVPAETTSWVWVQGLIASLYADANVRRLPPARYPFVPTDGVPNGFIGYDYADNPCGFASLHFDPGPGYDKANNLVSLAIGLRLLDRCRHASDQPPIPDHLGGFIAGGDPETWMPDVWEWVCETFQIGSTLDIGCGTAVNLAWFADRGLDVLGVDGHPAAIAAARLPGRVVQHDFTTGPWEPPRPFDLGISTEFVEHVEPRFEPNWIAAARCCRYLMMSHALPGQGGMHHVNEQTSEYWIERMEAAGFEHMANVTAGLRRTCEWRPARYCRNTLLFFRRRDDDALA